MSDKTKVIVRVYKWMGAAMMSIFMLLFVMHLFHISPGTGVIIGVLLVLLFLLLFTRRKKNKLSKKE